MEGIGREDLGPLFHCIGTIMEEHLEELCEMDAALGDGDLGLTMKKGFCALPGLIESIGEADIGTCLMKAGVKMASVVPSTMGTLMASGMMSGGRAIIGAMEIGPKQLAAYLTGFSEGIAKRGKCVPGERTVLDALAPAAHAARDVLFQQPQSTLREICSAALEGAQEGMEATKGMVPKYGKAAVFSDRAVGTVDQGAYAGCLMIQGYYRYICSKP